MEVIRTLIIRFCGDKHFLVDNEIAVRCILEDRLRNVTNQITQLSRKDTFRNVTT